jgi:hypothetical protein
MYPLLSEWVGGFLERVKETINNMCFVPVMSWKCSLHCIAKWRNIDSVCWGWFRSFKYHHGIGVLGMVPFIHVPSLNWCVGIVPFIHVPSLNWCVGDGSIHSRTIIELVCWGWLHSFTYHHELETWMSCIVWYGPDVNRRSSSSWELTIGECIIVHVPTPLN